MACHPIWLLARGAVTLRLHFPHGAGSLALSDEARSVESPSKQGGAGPGRQPRGGEHLTWTSALQGLCFHDVREAELTGPQIQEAAAPALHLGLEAAPPMEVSIPLSSSPGFLGPSWTHSPPG